MPDKVLEEVAMANEDADKHEPVQSEVLSDNINVVVNLNTRNQQRKENATDWMHSYLLKQQ